MIRGKFFDYICSFCFYVESSHYIKMHNTCLHLQKEPFRSSHLYSIYPIVSSNDALSYCIGSIIHFELIVPSDAPEKALESLQMAAVRYLSTSSLVEF